MVVSTKIYKCLPEFGAETLANKLRKAKLADKVDNPETGGLTTLQTTVEKVAVQGKHVVRGVIRYDVGTERVDREGKTRFVIETIPVEFSFFIGSLFFTSFVRRVYSNIVANKMARLVMNNMKDPMLTCRITTSNIEDFLRKNPHTMIFCWWHGLDLTGLSRAGLGGSDIAHTQDFKRYNVHGYKSTVWVKLHEKDLSVLINEEATVVFYSSLTRDEMEDFIRKEIIPRCS